MSDGKVHTTFTAGASFGILSSIGLSKILDIPQMFLSVGGCMLGFFLSPDLDVDNGYIGNYYARKFYIGFIYDIFWKPYRLSLKHRSFWSHFPIVSTVVRMLYLVFPLSILLFKDQPTPVQKIIFYLVPSLLMSLVPILILGLLYSLNVDILYYSLPIILGLIVSDVGHWMKDNV